MSMVFEDRVSAYPNRYAVTDENGNVSHVILERADEPTIPGTPLNAETFNEMQESIERNVNDMIDDHIADTGNPHRVTYEQVGAAPAGYGLGAASMDADDVGDNGLNSCIKNGWYWTGNTTPNSPDDLQYAAVAVNTRLRNQIVQTLTSILLDRGCQMIRTSEDGGITWVEEWVNPPLYVDTEYRTTERFGGKAVYAVRPNIEPGSSAAKAVPFAKNVDCLVRVEGYWNSPDGSMKVPFTTAYFVDSVYVDKDGDDFRLRVDFNTDTAIYNGYPVIYYTKTS